VRCKVISCPIENVDEGLDSVSVPQGLDPTLALPLLWLYVPPCALVAIEPAGVPGVNASPSAPPP